MLTRGSFKGLYILLMTPMNDQMQVDYEAHSQNVRKLIDLGVDGLVLTPAWNGEVHTCTDEEREQLLQIAVAESKGKVMCVPDCSGPSTAEAIRRSRRAIELGADAILAAIPYCVSLSNAEMLQYWRDMAGACNEVGVIAYNRGGPTRMTNEDFNALADVPNFLGSKLAGGLVEYVSQVKNTPQKHMPVEAVWSYTKLLGGKGVMAAWIYACPQYMMKWWRAIYDDDVATAMRMQDEVKDLLHKVVLAPMRAGYSEPAALKAFAEAMGQYHCGKPRKPSFAVPRMDIDRMRREVEEEFPQFLAE